MTDEKTIKATLEAALLAAGETLSVTRLLTLFPDSDIDKTYLEDILASMENDYADRSFTLKSLASGYCFQVRQEHAPALHLLWEERPPRYSRALLETLVIIAYRQPITRAEIEDIRGVAVSTSITKTLLEREWIRVLGHRDVPGKPGIYGTTKQFLDYFNLSNLSELPPLEDIKDLDSIAEQLDPQLPFIVSEQDQAQGEEQEHDQTLAEQQEDDHGQEQPAEGDVAIDTSSSDEEETIALSIECSVEENASTDIERSALLATADAEGNDCEKTQATPEVETF